MPRSHTAFRAVYLLIALACLANAGCLAALVGAGAAAGGAGGYAYYKGNVCQSYPAARDDAWFAAHAALADLGMPIVEENQAKGVIVSKTGDGDKVHVHVQALANRVPADGPATRVGVRVAFFGDHDVSQRILAQIGVHLRPATSSPGITGTP